MIVTVWVLMALTIAQATPAWEANDEPDHVANVATLTSGHWYRLGTGFESHQPPLYYLLLAGYERVLGLPPKPVVPPPYVVGPPDHGLYSHDGVGEGSVERRLKLLRTISVLLGAATLLLTAAAVRRMTTDPWTPVVAAALVACVPKFTFVSGVINNDNLTNALGGLGLLLGALALKAGGRRTRARVLLAVGLGAALGALIATKLTGAALGPALLLAAVAAPGSARLRGALLGAFVLGFAAAGGWYLVQNQVRHGDPLAAEATRDYLMATVPNIFVTESFTAQAFEHVPRNLWRSFWYTSGWNQFVWVYWWVYLPLWIGLGAGLLALVVPPRRRRVASRAVMWFCGVGALCGAVALWIVGIETTTVQARVAFFSLPFLGALFALGLERVRAPVLVRFALPVLGIVMTLGAIKRDVFDAYPF